MEKVVHLVFYSHHRQPYKKFYKRQKSQEKSVQYHHLYTASSVQPSPVPSSLHCEFSPASSDFTVIQTNFNSTLCSTTFKSEGESPFKFSLKLRSRNQLDQPSELRIFHLKSTISKITTKTQLTTFSPLDSINHRANFTVG